MIENSANATHYTPYTQKVVPVGDIMYVQMLSMKINVVTIHRTTQRTVTLVVCADTLVLTVIQVNTDLSKLMDILLKTSYKHKTQG